MTMRPSTSNSTRQRVTDTLRLTAYGMIFCDAALAVHDVRQNRSLSDKQMKALQRVSEILRYGAADITFTQSLGKAGAANDVPSEIKSIVHETLGRDSYVLRVLANQIDSHFEDASEQSLQDWDNIFAALDAEITAAINRLGGSKCF